MAATQSYLQAFYSTQSPITDPGDHADLFRELPHDLPALCHIVQGLVIHVGLVRLHGVDVPRERASEADIRDVAPMLARIHELDLHPLTVARPAEKRLLGHCRVSAVLLCSMLRAQGLPARVRFGFSRYYAPGFSGDHELCEYWHPTGERWTLVDQDLDDPELNGILERINHPIIYSFDAYDVPRDQFIEAGSAWQMYRAGNVDASIFGFDPGHSGAGYIRRQLLRDLAALNRWEVATARVEADGGADSQGNVPDPTDGEIALLDSVAAVTQTPVGDGASGQLQELQALYASAAHARLISQT